MATSSSSQSRTALCVARGAGALLLCGLCGLVVAAAGALYFFVGARSAGTGPIIALPVATATPRPPEALEIPIDKEALLSFYQRHVNQGPEVIP